MIAVIQRISEACVSIEDKIYSAIKSKKNYTLNIFKKDYTNINL